MIITEIGCSKIKPMCITPDWFPSGNLTVNSVSRVCRSCMNCALQHIWLLAYVSSTQTLLGMWVMEDKEKVVPAILEVNWKGVCWTCDVWAIWVFLGEGVL